MVTAWVWQGSVLGPTQWNIYFVEDELDLKCEKVWSWLHMLTTRHDSDGKGCQ